MLSHSKILQAVLVGFIGLSSIAAGLSGCASRGAKSESEGVIVGGGIHGAHDRSVLEEDFARRPQRTSEQMASATIVEYFDGAQIKDLELKFSSATVVVQKAHVPQWIVSISPGLEHAHCNVKSERRTTGEQTIAVFEEVSRFSARRQTASAIPNHSQCHFFVLIDVPEKIHESASVALKLVHGNVFFEDLELRQAQIEVQWGEVFLRNSKAPQLQCDQCNVVGLNVFGAFVLALKEGSVALENDTQTQALQVVGKVAGDVFLKLPHWNKQQSQLELESTLGDINLDLSKSLKNHLELIPHGFSGAQLQAFGDASTEASALKVNAKTNTGLVRVQFGGEALPKQARRL